MIPMRISDAEALGIFVVHHLNILYSITSVGEDVACCADCCAPCDVIRQLADSGDDLEQVIAAAPEHIADSWVERGVDRDWLASCWDCQDNPPCESSCAG